MKLNKTLKKVLAVVLSLAMVVTSITVYNTTAKAAADIPDGYTQLEEGWTTYGEIVGNNPSSAEKEPFSKWTVYSGNSWANVIVATKGGSDTEDEISIFVAQNWNMEEYGIQIARVFTDLTANKVYDYVINYTVAGEEKTYAKTGTADADGKVIASFGVGNLAAEGEYINVTSTSIKEADVSSEEKVKEHISSNENVAKGKAAFASSESAKTGGIGPAANVVDGNLTTRWAANKTDDNEYVGIDLGGVYSVSSVALVWEGAYASEYDVQVSTDGDNYSTVASKTATKNETLEIEFDEVEAQFVRILCKKAGTQWNCSIWEMGVFGTYLREGVTTKPIETEPVVDNSGYFTSVNNIAKGAVVTATSTDPLENGGNVLPANLTDGNMGTYWASWFTTHSAEEGYPAEYADNDNVVIDLGKAVDASTLEKIVIAWRTEATLPRKFSVEVSEDGETYTTAVAQTNLSWNDIEDKEHHIGGYTLSGLTGNVQYVKVNFSGDKAYGYQISEIAVIAETGLEEPSTDPSVEKPAAPAGLTNASAGDLNYYFAWQAVAGAESYNVYLNGNKIANVEGTSYDFDDELFAEYGSYTVEVTAVKGGVESDKSAPVTFDSEDPSVIKVTAGQVTVGDFGPQTFLTWTSVKGAVTYKIYMNDENTYATAPDGFVFDKEDRLDTTNAVAVPAGKTTYIVVAYGADGEIARGTVEVTYSEVETPPIDDDDYSNLDWKTAEGSDIAIAIKEDLSFQNVNFLDDGRVEAIVAIASGSHAVWPDFEDVTLNGEPISTAYYNLGAAFYVPADRAGLKAGYNVIEAKSTSNVQPSRIFHVIINYTPATTNTYTVTIDGEKVATVEEGKDYLLPATATIGYFDGTDMYKAGSTVTNVTSDLAFTTVNTEDLTVEVSKGAGMRLSNTLTTTGLRFKATVTSSVEGLVDSKAISTGMEIAVQDDNKSVDIPNTGWYNGAVGTYYGAVVDIALANYNRAFVAKAYVTVNYKDGSQSDEPIYSDASEARSAQAVAQKVLESGLYNDYTDMLNNFINGTAGN